jgi:hypothetical protein
MFLTVNRFGNWDILKKRTAKVKVNWEISKDFR